MLRIAIPNKGRLTEAARTLLERAGLEFEDRGERALLASLGGEFLALFVRAQDIPEFVADGAADLGITGRDLVEESGRELEVLLDLGFGRCRLALAGRDDPGASPAAPRAGPTAPAPTAPAPRPPAPAAAAGSGAPPTALASIPDGARVATSFPRLAGRFFREAGRSVELVPVSGAAEIAPHLGVADYIVDLVSTGSSLKMNGLQELATVLESTALLIARPDVVRGAGTGRSVRELVAALESVIRAEGKRYLMANVPRAALPEIKRVLPGINGPTIVDVMDSGDFVAAHAVVDRREVYRTIASLKELGAEGILVTRIERLMP